MKNAAGVMAKMISANAIRIAIRTYLLNIKPKDLDLALPSGLTAEPAMFSAPADTTLYVLRHLDGHD